MGKTSLAARASEFRSEGIVVDQKELICTMCGINVKNSKFQIKQHVETAKHKSNCLLKSKQQTITNMPRENEFVKDVCQVRNIFFRSLINLFYIYIVLIFFFL